MIKIKINVPDEEFGTLEKVFEFKDYLSLNEVFVVGLPTKLISGLADMKDLLSSEKTKEILKNTDPNDILKYQLKLLNILQIDPTFDIGTLPMPIILELTENPKLIKAIEYSFGQTIDIKTDDIPNQKKNKILMNS